MLAHLLYARAAGGYDKPDLQAHAQFSCQVNGFGHQVSSHIGNLISRVTGYFHN
ncbi:MAG: hypothetical protein AAF478_03350 [Pseudomonadota bacterium]